MRIAHMNPETGVFTPRGISTLAYKPCFPVLSGLNFMLMHVMGRDN